MTVAELCEAALTVGDNTAARLLASFGGPSALTACLPSLGDDTTRLERYEPELNEPVPGDARDTTTPAAMTEFLRKLALGSALSAESRAQITAWLVACTTGDKRLRAGCRPAGGSETKPAAAAAMQQNHRVVWPPGRAPVIVTSYCIDGRAAHAKRRGRKSARRRGGLSSLPYCGAPRFALAVSSILAK